MRTRIVFLIGIIALVQTALAQIPATLQPPKSETLFLQLTGKGTQIYTCQSSTWTLKAPDAKLYSKTGELKAHHYAGPTWEDTAGNKVVGKVIAKEPSPNPHAIPWLLLTAVSHEGKTGFANVTTIQRINTEGGQAPATACSENQETAIPYQAVYNFYVKP